VLQRKRQSGAVLLTNAPERAALLGSRGVTTARPDRRRPANQASFSAVTCSRVSAIPSSCISSMPGSRRRSRARRRFRTGSGPVGTASSRYVHLEDVLSANQPVCVGSSSSEVRPRPHEPSPAEPRRYLRTPPRERPRQLGHVERIRADRLVGVEHDERAAVVRRMRAISSTGSASRCGSRRRDRGRTASARRSPPRTLERGAPTVGRDGTTCARAAPARPRSGRSSGSEVADHDSTACRSRSRLASGSRLPRARFVTATSSGLPFTEAGRTPARSPCARPSSQARPLVPAGEVLVVGGAHRVRERALRATSDVDEPPRSGSARDTRNIGP